MEIIVLIAILIAGVAVYYNTRTKPTKSSVEAPYKVEAPVVDTADIALAQMPDGAAAVVETSTAKKKPAAKKAAAKKAPAKKAPAKTKKSK